MAAVVGCSVGVIGKPLDDHQLAECLRPVFKNGGIFLLLFGAILYLQLGLCGNLNESLFSTLFLLELPGIAGGDCLFSPTSWDYPFNLLDKCTFSRSY